MIKIFLFGGFRVFYGDLTSEIKMTRGDKRLLAYLLLNRGRAHPRVKLYGVLWGDRDEESARGSLSSALWRLRRTLKDKGAPGGPDVVKTRSEEVGFNTKCNHWQDVASFEEQVHRVTAKQIEAMDADDAAQLKNALDIYTGELLEGFYEDWVLRERERLHGLRLRGMEHMMRYKRHARAFDKAEIWGKEVLSQDPLREDVHRELMRLYAESGRRGAAARQYAICCGIMEEYLGSPPSEETETLYIEIAGRRSPDRPAPSPAPAFPVHSAGGAGCGDVAHYDLHAKIHKLEQLAHRLQSSIQVLKKSIGKSLRTETPEIMNAVISER